jgi:hypothetical protein
MNTIWKKLGALCLLTCTVLSGQAQKEAHNWMLATNSGMTWNTTQTIGALNGLPTPIDNNAVFGDEGVLSMSDAAGKLLFYSNGENIWNAAHERMNTDALTGYVSSAQSGIAIPYPGQATKYIVFTISLANDNILSCTIVDMTLNGGLGGIPAGQQNIRLTGASGILGESVSAVRHANSADYWIVAPGRGSGTSSNMNVWKVTSAGVQTACIASYPLPADTEANPSANGYLRFSPDGKHFAWPEYVSGQVFFGNFDPLTGVCSNIKMYNGVIGQYGMEFSPDGKILYAGQGGVSMRVYKFDDLLNAANPDLVAYKEEIITGTETYVIGALQTGPDGRIYGALYDSKELLVINNPNEYDNYNWTVVSGLINNRVVLGLPNFLGAYFKEKTVFANILDTALFGDFIISYETQNINENEYVGI